MGDGTNTANSKDLDRLTDLFKLLSDRTRLNILMILAAGERNVTSLCEELNLPQPTVSHHLGLLRNGEIIGNRRAGKQVFYELNGRVDTAALSLVIDVSRFNVKIHRKAAGE